jgi:hypothetical protein
MIMGALRLPRPRLKAPGVYSALAGGAAQRANTPATDFVTWRDVFPRHGAKCAPQFVWLAKKNENFWMWRNVPMKE